jgi:23S rRNA (uracil1939-C5)-methyltransferase
MRANEALVDFVVKQIKGKQLTELYAGSGNFSFPLQRIGKRVVAVEASKELVDRASGKGVQFVCALAEKYVRQNKVAGSVLLDPPRGGAKSCVEAFGSDISEVVYVSCNPATLGRDLEILTRKGLKLEMVTLFDMFPQTAHVECVAVLRR